MRQRMRGGRGRNIGLVDMVGGVQTAQLIGREFDKKFKSKKKPNPSIEDAARLSEEWHGRPTENIEEVIEYVRDRKNFGMLGDLIDLVVAENVDSSYMVPITWGDEPDKPAMGDRNVIVAGVPKINQIQFIGGDQCLDEDLGGFDWLGRNEIEKDLITIGVVISIGYWTDKHHLVGSSGKPEPYNHPFGEIKEGDRVVGNTGLLPNLVYDKLNKRLLMVGGDYKITDRGLDG